MIVGRFAIARFFFGEAAEGAARRRPDRDASPGRRDIFCRPTASRPSCGFVARHERHADTAVVCRHRLLADRISLPPMAWRSICDLGAVGVWIGLSCGTAIYAVLLVLRFRRLAAQAGVPEKSFAKSTPDDLTPARLLAGAQFSDAFSARDRWRSALDARARAARSKMLAHSPRWIEALLRLRNFLVAPLA